MRAIWKGTTIAESDDIVEVHRGYGRRIKEETALLRSPIDLDADDDPDVRWRDTDGLISPKRTQHGADQRFVTEAGAGDEQSNQKTDALRLGCGYPRLVDQLGIEVVGLIEQSLKSVRQRRGTGWCRDMQDPILSISSFWGGVLEP